MLGPAGENCFKLIKAIDEYKAISCEVNYDYQLLLDPLRDVENDTLLVDLPAPSVENLRDKYQRWEYQTPFKRTIFKAFKLAVERAEQQDGKCGYVTLVSLA